MQHIPRQPRDTGQAYTQMGAGGMDDGALLARVNDICDVGLVVLDGLRRIRAWNRWLADASGLRKEAAFGKRLEEAFPDLDNRQLMAAVDDVYTAQLPSVLTPRERPAVFPLAARDAEIAIDGHMMQVVTLSPLELTDGTIFCLIQISDVTRTVYREDRLREQAGARSTVRDGRGTEERVENLKSVAGFNDDGFPKGESNIANATAVSIGEFIERGEAEEKPIRTETALAPAANAARFGHWTHEPTRPEIEWSPECLRILGRSEETWAPTWENFCLDIHPDDRQRFEHAHSGGMVDGEPYAVQVRYRVAGVGEEVIWIRIFCDFSKDESGRIRSCGGIVQVITESERSEDALIAGEKRPRSIVETIVRDLSESRHQEKLLSLAVESMPQGFMWYDPEGELIFCNTKMHELFPRIADELAPGARRKEIRRAVRKTGQIIVDTLSSTPNLTKTRTRASEVNQICQYRTAEGLWILQEDFFMPDGGCVGIRTDVTALKQAQDDLLYSEERFIRSQTFANVGTWDWNIHAGSLYWSDRVAALMGGEEGRLAMTPDDFFAAAHPDDLDMVRAAIGSSIKNGDEFSIDHRVVWPDGSVRWLRQSGDTVFDTNGEPSRVLGVVRDITDLKEAIIREHDARQNAEAANRAKSEFLSTMSHELRTPMNAILGFSQLLESDRKNPLTERQKTQIRHVLKNGEHLLELIDEVLDLSKIESGKLALTMEVVNTRGLLNDCVSVAETLARRMDIEIIDRTGAPLPALYADPLRARQAILNLLSNAVKYGSRNGKVWIDAEQHAENTLRICVTDTGLGIPKEKQADLFQPFNRLGAENTDVEGTGIGLVLTKNLIEEMDGAIGFVSTPKVGCTFWLEFSTADGEAPVADLPTWAEAGPADEVRDQVMLYVEDDPSNLALMEAVVERFPNLTMLTTHTAEIGLAMAERHGPDIIILDVNLPEMDGIEAARRLKESDVTAAIPVFALSADAMPETIRRGMEAGIRDYLTKPINIEKLMNVLEDVLGGPI